MTVVCEIVKLSLILEPGAGEGVQAPGPVKKGMMISGMYILIYAHRC